MQVNTLKLKWCFYSCIIQDTAKFYHISYDVNSSIMLLVLRALYHLKSHGIILAKICEESVFARHSVSLLPNIISDEGI